MSSEFEPDEFQELCDAVFDEQVTREQLNQLEELFLSSPELKRRYVELAHQHASLSWTTEQEPSHPLAFHETRPPRTPNNARGQKSNWRNATILAGSILATVVGVPENRTQASRLMWFARCGGMLTASFRNVPLFVATWIDVATPQAAAVDRVQT